MYVYTYVLWWYVIGDHKTQNQSEDGTNLAVVQYAGQGDRTDICVCHA